MKADKILTKIRSRRLELNYSQDYVASQLNLQQSAYNKLENGSRKLTVEKLLEIAVILNLDKNELLQLLVS
jgi:transcriptional regulator with XRE-family HTH domain